MNIERAHRVLVLVGRMICALAALGVVLSLATAAVTAAHGHPWYALVHVGVAAYLGYCTLDVWRKLRVLSKRFKERMNV